MIKRKPIIDLRHMIKPKFNTSHQIAVACFLGHEIYKDHPDQGLPIQPGQAGQMATGELFGHDMKDEKANGPNHEMEGSDVKMPAARD